MAISAPMTDLRCRSGGRALLAVALLVAACGTSAPTDTPSVAPATASPAPTSSPSPSASPTPTRSDANGALYAQIEGQVVELRGLQPKTAVARDVLDEAGLRAYVTKSFNEDNPASLVTSTERLYKALLLMPQDASLEDLFVELYTSQALGLYSEKAKQMIVVSRSGTIGPMEKVTYAHEYTHALQDQNFGLRSVVGDAKDQTDRSLARTALVEGDAYLTMGLWAQAHLTSAELAQVATAADPASEAALAKLPEIVKEQLLFPATSGITLAVADFTRGGFATVDKRFANPPASTEQILHADKLAAGEKPVTVAFPADLASRLGVGWTMPLQDTMGEFQLGILLRDAGGATSDVSSAAAAGWGGDRVALLEGPGGANGVVLDTVWDTNAEAAEFSAAVDGLVTKLKAAGRSAAVLNPGPNRVVLISAGNADTLGRLANVLGLAG